MQQMNTATRREIKQHLTRRQTTQRRTQTKKSQKKTQKENIYLKITYLD